MQHVIIKLSLCIQPTNLFTRNVSRRWHMADPANALIFLFVEGGHPWTMQHEDVVIVGCVGSLGEIERTGDDSLTVDDNDFMVHGVFVTICFHGQFGAEKRTQRPLAGASIFDHALHLHSCLLYTSPSP